MSHDPVGVLLFNLGGPATLAEVEPFLVKLFSDREIIELPFGARLQPAMARLIAKMRGPGVRGNYSLIGGGSPQLRLTRAQAAALETRLNRGRGAGEWEARYGTGPVPPRFRVHVAMRYSEPSAATALKQMQAAGIRQIVTVTLFPHYTKATTGSSRREFDRRLQERRFRDWGFEIRHVDRYPDDARYLDALADTVLRARSAFSPEARERLTILFSAHGLPQKFIDEGDPYLQEIEKTRAGLLARLRLPNRQVLGYQSRTGPVKWQGPGTEELIEELGREGVKELLIVPLSFVSDHIETLYEVDILFREAAARSGITEYRRPEALNTHPKYIEALAGLVEAELGRWDRTRQPDLAECAG